MDDPRAEQTERPSLPKRLRERKLVQWALAYLAGGWVVLEVVSTLQDGLGWPSTVFPVVVGALSVGFLVTLVLAWYHGEQGRQRVSGPELLIMAGILGVSGLLVSVLLQPDRSGDLPSDNPAAPSVEASVAVLPFVNMSGNPDNEYFSDGITAEILTALVCSFPTFVFRRARRPSRSRGRGSRSGRSPTRCTWPMCWRGASAETGGRC